MRRICLAAAICLTACASQGVRPLSPQDLATAPYQSVVTATLTGSLMYEGGCLLFRDDQNSVQFLPVWPDGSHFTGSALTFHRPGKDDQILVVAEEFEMSGQPLPWATLSGASYQPYHRQCAAQPFLVSAIRPAN